MCEILKIKSYDTKILIVNTEKGYKLNSIDKTVSEKDFNKIPARRTIDPNTGFCTKRWASITWHVR